MAGTNAQMLVSRYAYSGTCGPGGKPRLGMQAPLQNNAEDWTLGSRGCYDAASLARLQCSLMHDLHAAAVETVK